MKTLNLILIVAAIFLLASCQKKSDIPSELSSADEIATEGMEEAEHEAEEYNDSLVWCTDTSNACVATTVNYYDSLFHYNSDEFDFHHENYSHNNLDDDHHHSAVSTHSHGDAEHPEEEEGADHGHSIEGHQEMEEIRAEHEQYHPN
jgi:hypothetical protein